MGADLCLAMVPIRKTREQAFEKLKTYDKDDLIERLSFVDYLLADSDDNDVVVSDAIDLVSQCLNNVYDWSDHGSRDTAIVRFGNDRFLVTGGMTWGDDPTDAYRDVLIVSVLDLTWDGE